MAKTINRCLVEINRNPTVTVPDEVWDWEIPVLQELHGEQSVQVVSSRTRPIPEDFTAVDAYAQLERKYNTDAGKQAIRFVYRSVQALAKASGLPYQNGDENTVKYQEAQVIVRDPDAEPEAQAA